MNKFLKISMLFTIFYYIEKKLSKNLFQKLYILHLFIFFVWEPLIPQKKSNSLWVYVVPICYSKLFIHNIQIFFFIKHPRYISSFIFIK